MHTLGQIKGGEGAGEQIKAGVRKIVRCSVACYNTHDGINNAQGLKNEMCLALLLLELLQANTTVCKQVSWYLVLMRAQGDVFHHFF